MKTIHSKNKIILRNKLGMLGVKAINTSIFGGNIFVSRIVLLTTAPENSIKFLKTYAVFFR